MMMTEMVDHKRRMHDGFVLNRSHNDEKRLKSGAGANISAKDKKDKIGERVAKLQQLVSPFGKSDTASVLSEATDYIKFLHDQLQVLSAPYLRTTVTGEMEEGDYYSLRNRGLCLMPVASTLRIAQSNGADLWAPVNSNRNPQN
ncbi:transcription factor bHLH113-like [Canna indica]|uniref:Transcription factor bHLH113-like n=1 Tax=Canna indica TaxID=4628 RepID=A0AAQ3KBH1_9LILI|nr:transcription factor bHLH113-like [Canna indica]